MNMMSGTKMNEVEAVTTAAATAGGANGAKAGAAYSAAKLAAIFAGAGGVFIAVLTMAFTPAKSFKEGLLAASSMTFSAVTGSAFAMFYFGWHFPDTIDGHLARSGLAAVCGAVGWLLVRGWFKWSETAGVDSVGALFSWLIEKLKSIISKRGE